MSTVKWDTILPVNFINFTNLNAHLSPVTNFQKSGSCIISANRSIFRTLAQEVVSMSQRLLIYHILRSLYCSFLIPFTWPITFPPRLTPNTISINSIKNCTYIMQTLNKKSRTVSTGLFPLLNVLSTNLNGS
jgi:hypothetical protein